MLIDITHIHKNSSRSSISLWVPLPTEPFTLQALCGVGSVCWEHRPHVMSAGSHLLQLGSGEDFLSLELSSFSLPGVLLNSWHYLADISVETWLLWCIFLKFLPLSVIPLQKGKIPKEMLLVWVCNFISFPWKGFVSFAGIHNIDNFSKMIWFCIVKVCKLFRKVSPSRMFSFGSNPLLP